MSLSTKVICSECKSEWEYHLSSWGDKAPDICPDCRRKPKPTKCADCGQEFMDSDGEIRCADCVQRIREKGIQDEIMATMERIIPAHFRELETDRQDELKRYESRSLYITGKQGTGKSVFLYSMAKGLILAGQPVKIIRFPSWVMKMQSLFRNDAANPFANAEVIATFQGALFIDDLGAEKTTEYVRQLIYFILDEREQEDLRTVITSNLSLKEIDETIDPRASSRIAGMCDVLIFKGDDRRIKKGRVT
jgi:DNA replication protein DnaC